MNGYMKNLENRHSKPARSLIIHPRSRKLEREESNTKLGKERLQVGAVWDFSALFFLTTFNPGRQDGWECGTCEMIRKE
jgi:hypothetical protein